MSFKIFSLQIRGKIKPVETIENRRATLERDFKEFLEVDKSDELKEFIELEKWVNSNEFKKIKNDIKSLQFKGSSEYNQLRELARLNKNARLKKYFKIAGSNDLKRFEKLKSSEKFEKYKQLHEFVNGGQFKKEKAKSAKQTFKGSNEEKQIKDFTRLSKSAGIKAYNELHDSQTLKKHTEFSKSEKLESFESLKTKSNPDKTEKKQLKSLKSDSEIKAYLKFEKSKKLKLYRDTVGSSNLKRYEELKQTNESNEFKERVSFLKDKKKFEKTDAYKKYNEFKNLAADGEIKFVLKFEKSGSYKNYLDVKDSADLKRLNELKEITSSKEFLERKAYLEDKKKWEKSEEFAKEQKMLEIKKLPHIERYFKYKDTNDFDFIKNWKVTFEDHFESVELKHDKWSTTGYVAEKLLGDNYSMPGDLHTFSKENVKCYDKLTIEVKKQKSNGKVWKMPAGFVPTEFDYTAGMVSSHKSFWQEDGIFEVKAKFNPVKQVVSTVFLQGEENSPRITLFEMGTKNQVGVFTASGNGKASFEGLDLSNLKRGKSYIFTLEISGTNISWKINEVEVFSKQSGNFKFPLHLNASTIVVHEVPGSLLPVQFEIEWVKCYQKK